MILFVVSAIYHLSSHLSRHMNSIKYCINSEKTITKKFILRKKILYIYMHKFTMLNNEHEKYISQYYIYIYIYIYV